MAYLLAIFWLKASELHDPTIGLIINCFLFIIAPEVLDYVALDAACDMWWVIDLISIHYSCCLLMAMKAAANSHFRCIRVYTLIVQPLYTDRINVGLLPCQQMICCLNVICTWSTGLPNISIWSHHVLGLWIRSQNDLFDNKIPIE